MKICKKCNGTEFCKNGECKNCKAIRDKAWRIANPERNKELKQSWTINNREKSRAKVAKWEKLNPCNRAMRQRNRRARKMNSEGSLSKDLATKLFKLQKGKCACCGLPLGNDYQLDHIMPVALGGEHKDRNIQLLRSSCNHQKHAKHPIDFMRNRGFLL